MEHLQLFEILKTFSKRELLDLNQFLQIPSLGLSKVTIPNRGTLLSQSIFILDSLILKKQLPLIIELIPKAHHRQKVYQAISRYIAFQKNKMDEVNVQIHLQTHLKSNGLIKRALKKINMALTELDKKNRQIDYHFNKFKYYQNLVILTKESGEGKKNLAKLNHHQQLHYLESRMRVICEFCSRNQMPGYSYELTPADLNFVNQSKEQKDSAISALYAVYRLIQNPLESSHLFDQLLDFLKNEGINFERNYRKSFFEHLLNHCITMVKMEETDYAEKYLEIINVLESQQLLLDHKLIKVQRFKNIVTAHMYAGNIDKLEHFLRIYTKKLPRDRRQKAEQLAKLRLLFKKGDLDAYWSEHESIEKTHFKSPIEYTEFLRLELKVVYQLYRHRDCEIEDLEKLESRFRRYLTRHKDELHFEMADRCRNFLSALKELAAQGDFLTTPHRWLSNKEKLFYPADKRWLLSKYKKGAPVT